MPNELHPRLFGALALVTCVSIAPVAIAQAPTTGRIVGTVTDASSGIAVRATISVAPGARTARSDSAGRFVLRDVPAGQAVVTANAFGFRAERVTVRVEAGQEATIAIALHTVPRTLDAVRTVETATAEAIQARAPAGPSVTSMTARELASIPAVGERDVLRAAALLPGISARNDFWAGFNVRGGESDQTQVRLDGLPVFSPFHLGGLFSTFIAEAVSDVDARVGALPASYGGRLSGVLDVTSAEDARGGVHGAIDLSAVSATAKLGGALPLPGGSWSVAARRTYADALADLVVGDGAFPYHFQDAQLHGAMRTPGNGTLRVTAYTGLDLLQPTTSEDADTFGGNDAFRFDWGNRLAGLSFRQPLGARGELVQRVAYSAFHTSYSDDSTGMRLANTIAEARLSGELAARVGGTPDSAQHTLRAGYEVSRLRTKYDEHITAAAAGDIGGALIIADTLVRQRSGVRAVFAEDLWVPVSWASVRAGVRVEDVPTASWRGVLPRISAKLRANDALAFTLASGRYAQWVHAVRNEDLPIRIVDIWFASDGATPVSTGTELVGGTEYRFGARSLVRVEGYTKKFSDLLEPQSTVDPRLRPSQLRRFGGTSRGLDVLVRHAGEGPFSGWISYTYGRSIREQGSERYYPAHDRRHDANVVASYRLGERYTFGGRLGIATGTPYTGFGGTYSRWFYDPVARRWRVPSSTSNDRNEQVRTPRNVERYPTYRRLDLSAHRTSRVRGAEVDAFLNLVNVLNQRNVLLYAFDTEQSPPRVRGFSQLPFLPTIGARVAF